MKTSSIIIDDNPFNIKVLSDILQEDYRSISIVGTAANGKEALELIQTKKPDLVFLDVEMPDLNGFEVLAALKEINFQTIFVTAYSHYAIQAIRFNALDYLVKPIDRKELKQAIQRFISTKNNNNGLLVQNALHNIKEKNVLDQILYLPSQEGGIKMTIKDIIKIEGDRNYSIFHLANNKTKISSKTLGHFEEILKDKGFFRCHRSYVINHHHIKQEQKDYFLLSDESKIPISRRKKTEARSWFLKT